VAGELMSQQSDDVPEDVTEFGSAGPDVFLSYKREEKEIAQQIAEYLTTKGYEIWWDAALLAGEDFARVVHTEVRKAKAVVVLWSRRAVQSHWVKMEASIAAERGTLINAVIDDLPFEEIPGAFSHLQAVRLAGNLKAFLEAITQAIARKAVPPSRQGHTAGEARSILDRKVSESEYFLVIASSVDRRDFEEYLDRFGKGSQFAAVAQRRLDGILTKEAEAKSWRRWIAAGLAFFAGAVAVVSGLSTILMYFGAEPFDFYPSDFKAKEAATSSATGERDREGEITRSGEEQIRSSNELDMRPAGPDAAIAIEQAPTAVPPSGPRDGEAEAPERSVASPSRGGLVAELPGLGGTDGDVPAAPNAENQQGSATSIVQLPPDKIIDPAANPYSSNLDPPSGRYARSGFFHRIHSAPDGQLHIMLHPAVKSFRVEKGGDKALLLRVSAQTAPMVLRLYLERSTQTFRIDFEFNYDELNEDLGPVQEIYDIGARQSGSSDPVRLPGSISQTDANSFSFVTAARSPEAAAALQLLARARFLSIEMVHRNGLTVSGSVTLSDAASDVLREIIAELDLEGAIGPESRIAPSPLVVRAFGKALPFAEPVQEADSARALASSIGGEEPSSVPAGGVVQVESRDLLGEASAATYRGAIRWFEKPEILFGRVSTPEQNLGLSIRRDPNGRDLLFEVYYSYPDAKPPEGKVESLGDIWLREDFDDPPARLVGFSIGARPDSHAYHAELKANRENGNLAMLVRASWIELRLTYESGLSRKMLVEVSAAARVVLDRILGQSVPP
jgi:hypothetical protein